MCARKRGILDSLYYYSGVHDENFAMEGSQTMPMSSRTKLVGIPRMSRAIRGLGL